MVLLCCEKVEDTVSFKEDPSKLRCPGIVKLSMSWQEKFARIFKFLL
jgi:hypothetical protein